ncbi:MAG: type II secretion system protein [Pseudomonadota bacterium]
MMPATRVKQPEKKKHESGFTLIEMSMVMVIMGIVISIMMTVMPGLLKTGKIKEARAVLSKYDYVLQGYALANNRLPFADNNGDGLEDNVFVGTLPYRTLGLTHGNDVWGQPVKYAVYGVNPGADNLTTNIIEPPATTLAETFIANMNAAAITPLNPNIVYVTDSDTCAGGNRLNQAYVIASGGPKDMDGINGYFDLCNGAAGAGFNADNKIQSLDYDDLVRPMSIGELRAKF